MTKNKKVLLLVSLGMIIILGLTIGISVISNKKVVVEPAIEVVTEAKSSNSKFAEAKSLYEEVVKSSEKDFDEELRNKLDDLQSVNGVISQLVILEIETYKFGSEDELNTRDLEYITRIMTTYTNNDFEQTVWANEESKNPKEGDRIMTKSFAFQSENGSEINGSAVAYYDHELEKATLMNITVRYE